MDRPQPLRIIHLASPRSRIATIRDVAIILVCAALLLGTIADIVLARRQTASSVPARTTSCVSM